MLGPVYSHLTHFVPPPFPLLIIAPAIALDLLRPKIRTWSRWRRYLACGAVGFRSIMLQKCRVKTPIGGMLLGINPTYFRLLAGIIAVAATDNGALAPESAAGH